MTMPIETVVVTCPKCRKEYQTSYRGSFNLTLGEDFSEEYMRKMTTGTCPHCGATADLGTLLVERRNEIQVRPERAKLRRKK